MSVTETLADMNASSLLMVIRSRTFGMLCRVTFSGVNKHAVMHGNAEFFAPLMATPPRNGFPPLIKNLSMRSHSPKACRRFPFANANRACAPFASTPFFSIVNATRRLWPD